MAYALGEDLFATYDGEYVTIMDADDCEMLCMSDEVWQKLQRFLTHVEHGTVDSDDYVTKEQRLAALKEKLLEVLSPKDLQELEKLLKG